MSKSPSLRRIQADIRELALDPSDQYFAAPLESDMFEWHFTIRGAEGTDFEGGIYHGRILLPAEYPFKPPHIMFLTPSGRFETNTKICLSFSAYHPELWQPAWGIRLILEALISFLPTPGDGAIGALDWSPAERKRLAKESQRFSCPQCGPITTLLPKLDPERKKEFAGNSKSGKPNNPFAKEIAKLQQLQQRNEGVGSSSSKNKNVEEKKKAKSTTKPESDAGKKKNNDGDTNGNCRVEKDQQNNMKEDEKSTILESNNPESTTSGNDDTCTHSAQMNSITSVDTDAASPEKTAELLEENKSKINATSDESEPKNRVDDDHSADVIANNNDAVGVAAAATHDIGNTNRNTISWMYDLLLNVSIVLMLMICTLFAKKGYDLSRELREIQEIPLVETVTNAAVASATASAATATSSEL